jgi:SAM-dependent methyltransferase
VTTFLNERAVELPIVVHELQRMGPARLLEIGNVLNYYLDHPHVVVDKYEVSPGVLNQDVVEFSSPEPFDMIVSISTIEHVGWDELPKDPEKTIRAIQHLRSLLAPGGRLVCTMPLGYNPHLDAHLAASRLPFDDVRYLRRLNARNEWHEATAIEVSGSKYDTPYMHANALAVGFASRPVDR